jgi:hypothetical protein
LLLTGLRRETKTAKGRFGKAYILLYAANHPLQPRVFLSRRTAAASLAASAIQDLEIARWGFPGLIWAAIGSPRSAKKGVISRGIEPHFPGPEFLGLFWSRTGVTTNLT